MPATLTDILTSHRTGRPIVMGVLNVTPDSFSDGGRFLRPAVAVARARRMADEGADIIDLGAESTRPGSGPATPDQQIDRLGEILPAVVECGPVVSIDTTSAAVAAVALDAGAAIINDVSAGRHDPKLLPLAAERNAAVCLMHMLDRPRTMQADPHYDDVVADVRRFLAERIDAATAAGVKPDNIIVDPGIGFGKLLEHNLSLLACTRQLVSLGRPVLIGPSRKRFIGQLSGEQVPARRLGGTIAACLACCASGATIFRVHDVAPLVQALAIWHAIRPAGDTQAQG